MAQNYCGSCGAELSPDVTNYCTECGEALKSRKEQKSEAAVQRETSDVNSPPDFDVDEELLDANASGFKLMEDETILISVHPFGYVNNLIYLFAGLCILSGLFFIIASAGGGFFVAIGIITFIGYSVYRNSITYILTNRRVVKRKGIFSKSQDEIRLEDIENLEQKSNTLWGRGYGKLEFRTTTVGSGLKLKDVPKYNKVAHLIRELIDRKTKR